MRVSGKNSHFTRNAFALVFVSFLLSTIVSLVSLHMMSQRNVREMNKVLATQIYDHIYSELSGPIMAARTMSNDYFLAHVMAGEQNSDEEQFARDMRAYLAGIERGLGYKSAFVISETTGRYYTRDGHSRNLDMSHGGRDSWYPAFMRSDDLYALDVDNDEIEAGELTVFVNAKLRDEAGTILGICGVGVRMDGIQELFATFERAFGVKINLVDERGLVEVDTNKENIERSNLKDLIAGGPSDEYVYQSSEDGRFVVTKYLDNLNWYLVVQSEGPNELGEFANVVMLNVALCGVVMILLVAAMRWHTRQTTELMSASLVDHATRLYNRRAFEEDKASLLGQRGDKDLVCVTVDVNGLKTANDTLGHAAGDELIRGAADCLYASFEPYGKMYRIGGDEFAAILHVPWAQLEDVMQGFERAVAAWSGSKVERLSVSYGYASVHEFPDENIADLTRISDKRMYEDKAAYYERMGIERRKT
ncbi:MAG: GGDEF domain-containing protein [Atopobiaceae bacterium]|nr:GGDEF domain-containing protein [Atopobiaceae bacterium]